MIPIDVLQSVYYILYGSRKASSFTIECARKKYLVTARHVFYTDEDLMNAFGRKIYDIPCVEFNLFHDNKWKNLKGNVYFHENINIDIAVIELIRTVLPFASLTIDSESLSFGQDVYFLGYPLSQKTWLPYSTSPYPLPFVKKAIVAGFDIQENGDTIMYLDTQSNPGFSGGPVIFKHHENDKFKICGIMTGGLISKTESYSNKISISFAEDAGLTFVTHISHLEEIITRLQKRSNRTDAGKLNTHAGPN